MKRMHFLVAAASGLLALFSGSDAAAQATAPKPVPARTQSASPELDATFAAWDLDRNGALSLQEFRNGWALIRQAGEGQARLHAQFNAIDTNHNHAIELGEYANLVLVKQAGNSAPPLSQFDTNHDQRLEFPEYLVFVKHMTASQPPATTH